MSPELVRRRVNSVVRQLVVGTAEPLPVITWDSDDPNPIAQDSPVRVVHADASMFIGGVRALLLQTLHPVAMQAIADHSDYEQDPLGRLQRTAKFIADTTFGSAEAANNAVNIVRKVHSKVVGTMPDGSLYRADDPHLLGWVHATEVDSFLASYQKYGRKRLTPDECDRYIADMGIIGTALGVEDVPQSRAELAAMIDSYRDELHPTRNCRNATRFIFAPALPITALPFYGLIVSSSVTLLPRWARSMLLLPVAPGVEPFVIRPAATKLIRALRWSQAGPEFEPVD